MNEQANGLVEFLLARIAEDWEAARDAGMAATREPVALRPVDGAQTAGALTYMEFVVRHDPARVKAECMAKRAIVAKCLGALGEPESGPLGDILDLLALPYSDHPDYRQEWRADGRG